MAERLIPKLDRIGAEAGIKQMTPEIYNFAVLVRADTVEQWPQREWVGLTDAEKDGKRVLENGLLFNAAEVQAWELGIDYAEAKLKEKNNG
jgi:uncharacterized protein YeaC (DUF1315 family)